MATYETLREANMARQKEWDPSDLISPTYRATELAGEVGEACNVVKKLARETLGLPGSRSSRAHLAGELADIVICADLLAAMYGIDLLGVAVPMKFNTTSNAHGFKTLMKVLPLRQG